MTCRTAGCSRTPRPGYFFCDTCTLALLHAAFGPRAIDTTNVLERLAAQRDRLATKGRAG